MRITIDNEDGRGAVDYTGAVALEGPIRIERTLNALSRCTAEIVVGLHGLPAPARRGRVVVTADSGALLFTGYLAVEPVSVYAGDGAAGPVYRTRLTALSDEWLLDKQGSGASSATDGLALGVNSTGIVGQLTQAAQGTVNTSISVLASGNPRALGAYAVQPAAGWSTNAAAAANATYASYRVLNGTVSLTNAGAVTHSFTDADGTLNLPELSTAHARELANDVTVSGAEEPAAYVQEIFQGDGSTTEFVLSKAAFRGTNRTLLRDSFDEAVIDSSQWGLSDAGNTLRLSSLGLTMSGGNGFDGQTTLQAINAVEMAGCLLTELGGVTFGAASSGELAGFYNGAVTLTNCFAGFRVRQSVSTTGGVTVLVPVMNGAEVGSVFTPIAGHKYTLRLRLYCPEMQRIPQRYYCMVEGVVQEFGGMGGIDAPMQMVFEVLDEGVSSNTPATVLFDTAQASSPVQVTAAACTFAAVNSISLQGSVGSIEVTRPGSLWVVSTLPNGSQTTRLMGVAGQGVDCKVDLGSAAGTPGIVTFFAGRIPVAGERITVFYRTERRSVARLADAGSVQAESAAGAGVQVPGVSRWLGKVSAPVARSSVDCEAAAQAILAMGTARSAALAGAYSLVNPIQDIWPGDVLAITSAGNSLSLLVRRVAVEDSHAVPELLRYKVAFANDWATEWGDGLGLALSDTIAKDAILPAVAESSAEQALNNLQQIALTMLSTSAIQVDAGVTAPAGGGFEVRRRDWAFGTGVDTPDLVLRSPVRSFSLPRSAQSEDFYVRMYDGSTPPVYSRFSSALFVNWPVD